MNPRRMPVVSEPLGVGYQAYRDRRHASSGEGASRPVRDPASSRVATALTLAFAAWNVNPAAAQDEVRNFKKPILIVETEGHHAPVRSLIWRNDFSLLSGGQDKVVKMWDFRDGPRLIRTIRPMIWRGPAGLIYAMALSPKPDAQGQSLLAVAGFGVESRRGDITVYRVPGLGQTTTGEVVARLLPPPDDQSIGHRNSVLCMAFDPTGRILATGGNDNTVVLWDATRTVRAENLATYRPLRALKGHTGAIRALAFIPPDGRRLATVGEDGTLRLWDVARGVEVNRLDGNQRPVIINALAVRPDGLSIVIGREDGHLYRLDSLTTSPLRPVKLPTLATQGPVESLAYHPDGRRLVASLKSDKADTLDPMTVACDLEIRSMPAGEVSHKRRVPGLVYACAFSPDGTQLAYSGGMAQAISIQELGDLRKTPLELKGNGTTIFDLGFRAKDQVIGFTREFNPANLPGLYEGFDLSQRRSTTVPRAELRRAIKEYEGWKLSGSINQYRLEAVNADGRRRPLDLDKLKEGLWWSSTFVPPGPGHPRPTVAIGCAAGVVVYDLETGRRTRMFAGHSSPVVSVVPSPDGHWLASSSIDQTIMLYPLAGCDTRPALGATYRKRADGSWEVAAVAPKSFAASMGLQAGDAIVEAGIASRRANYKTPQQIGDEFVSRVDAVAPNDQIGLAVRRTLSIPFVGKVNVDLRLPSTKRDIAALTLMVDVSKEWILWAPQGFYDTSIEGDTRLLGWHLNPAYDQTRPTDFVPIVTYARTMYRPELLERLWTTRNLEVPRAPLRAVTTPPDRVAFDEQPPRIAFSALDQGVKPDPRDVWQASVPKPRIRLNISSAGHSQIMDRQVILDERLLDQRQILEPVAELQEDLEVELPPNRRVRLLVTASNVKERPRTEYIDLEYKAAPPPVPLVKPRLLLLSLGGDKFADGGFPAVPFADRDAESLAEFLSGHLIASDGTRPDPNLTADRMVLTGKLASAQAIREALDQFEDLLRKKQLKQGDIVAVVVASHVLEFKKPEFSGLAVFDARADNPAGSMISAQDLSHLFGQLTDYGCRVVLFLDGVHEGQLPQTFRSNIKSWVRDLQQNRRVITFVASKEGPGGVAQRDRHGLFALGVLNAFQGAGRMAARKDRNAAYTLEQFRTAVIQEVLNLSNRQQEAGGYFPPGVQPWTPFAKPSSSATTSSR